MFTKVSLRALFVILVLVIAATGIFFLVSGFYHKAANPVVTLTTQNQDFVSGTNYQTAGNYSAALQSYQSAASQTQDPSEQAVINFRIAVMQQFTGNFSQAITQLKQIAADQSSYTNSDMLRAYAVQELGSMYYSEYWADPSAAASIYAQTFDSEQPYASIAQESGTNKSLAYRHLFEYAAGLYPLGYSEARIAAWYANDLVTAQHGATTTSQGASDVTLVLQSLQKADADVARTDTPNNTAYALIPSTLQAEGQALGQLANLGAADPQQAEGYFQKSMQMASTSAPVGFTPYYYALFLAGQYGAVRASDIKQLLAPFGQQTISASVKNYLETIRTGSTYTQQRGAAVLLAQLDPDFKTYLISLGWHASDF